MKRTVRLTEQDLHRIVKQSVKRILRESAEDEYSEVRSNYYDYVKGQKVTYIDAWRTDDDNEEGEVVARVYDDGRVEWLKPQARNSKCVQEEIQQVLNDLRK